MSEAQAPIPPEFAQLAGAFPTALRTLLDAELAAGNRIAAAGSYPAPPAGGSLILAGQVTARARASGDGLVFRYYGRTYSRYSGWFTDDEGFRFFLIEPPLPPAPYPDRNAIRAGHLAPSKPTWRRERSRASEEEDPGTALGRFERSMAIGYEKWQNGVSYDLEAMTTASEYERARIEQLLTRERILDWRDVEALAALATPAAGALLQRTFFASAHEVSMAVLRYAPEAVPDADRIAFLTARLRDTPFSDLWPVLEAAAEFHPQEVVKQLLRCVLTRDGDGAAAFAALLLYAYGKAEDWYGWDDRPFLRRFTAGDGQDREAAFLELCGKIGVDPAPYV
jgi:hypothetical protein